MYQGPLSLDWLHCALYVTLFCSIDTEGTLLIFTVDAHLTLLRLGGHGKSFDLELSFAVCLATEH